MPYCQMACVKNQGKISTSRPILTQLFLKTSNQFCSEKEVLTVVRWFPNYPSLLSYFPHRTYFFSRFHNQRDSYGFFGGFLCCFACSTIAPWEISLFILLNHPKNQKSGKWIILVLRRPVSDSCNILTGNTPGKWRGSFLLHINYFYTEV